MTLVAAYKSKERIVVLSDTMITNTDSAAPNAVPGRLKSIVLNKWLTISYAGLSTQAIDAIRQIRLIKPLSTDIAISFLQEISAKFDGKMDFLICSHEIPNNPRLAKICNGSLIEGHDTYWIGNHGAAQSFSRFEPHPIHNESGSDYRTLEESRFTRKFHDYVRIANDPGVGGMVINCLASPYGHCYQDHGGVSIRSRSQIL